MWIVPWLKCSFMNLWISAFSSRFNGSNHPGSEFGAPGSNSITWSQMECWGSRCDCSSLNTLWCHWYSCGIFDGGLSSGAAMVTRPMKYRSAGRYWCLCNWCVYFALVALGALNITGSWVVSIHPLFQSIHGWNAANQGYPSIAFCSPRSDRKNLRLVVCCPVCTCKSV